MMLKTVMKLQKSHLILKRILLMVIWPEIDWKGSISLTRINRRLEKEKELAPTRQSFIYSATEYYQQSIRSTDDDVKDDEIKFQHITSNERKQEDAKQIRLKVKSDDTERDQKSTIVGDQSNKSSANIKPILVSHQKTPDEISQKPRVSFAQMDEIGQHSPSKPAPAKKQPKKQVEPAVEEEEAPKRTSLFKQRMMNPGSS